MKLILGTVQLGLDYGITNSTGKPDEETGFQIIKTALENNITDFDTARGYGDSERILGLANEKYNTMNIITKLDSLVDITQDTSQEEIINRINKSIDDSIDLLKISKMTTLLLHRFEHYNNKVIWNYLLQQDRIEKLGVSVYDVEEAIIALRDPNIKHIQLPINILDDNWFIPEFLELVKQRKDVIIHSRSIFLQGILLSSMDKWPKLDTINPEEYINKLNSLVTKCKLNNKIELCISYIKSIDWIDGIVMGVETLGQLKQNIELFKIRKLNTTEFNFVREMFIDVPKNLLNPSMW